MYSPPCTRDVLWSAEAKTNGREEGRDVAVCSYLSNHGKTEQEANNTDGKKKKFASMANVEEGRIHVRNPSDESFQPDKLEQFYSKMLMF